MLFIITVILPTQRNGWGLLLRCFQVDFLFRPEMPFVSPTTESILQSRHKPPTPTQIQLERSMYLPLPSSLASSGSQRPSDRHNKQKQTRHQHHTKGTKKKKIHLNKFVPQRHLLGGTRNKRSRQWGGKGGETSTLARWRRKVLGKVLKATYLKQHRRQDNAHRVPAGGIGASLAKNTFGRNALSLSGPYKASTQTKTEDEGRR